MVLLVVLLLVLVVLNGTVQASKGNNVRQWILMVQQYATMVLCKGSMFHK